MTTQREYVRSEINVLEYVVRVVADDISRQNGLYHEDQDMTAVKALVDCVVLSARILTEEEITNILNVYNKGLVFLAKNATSEMTDAAYKLAEERRLLVAMLRFRREL